MSPGDELARPQTPDAPAARRHLAQLYTEDEMLVRVVGDFVTAGLGQGDGILLIAKADHRTALARHLEDHGFTLGLLARRRQLILLDANEALPMLCVGGVPDRTRFQGLIGGAVRACRRAGFQRIRAFGEVVDLLLRQSLDAALHLEALWNELVATRGLTLLCGYRIDAFDPRAYHGILQRVCAAHSHLVPVEDCASLEHAVECAYLEVFGAGRDAAILRRLFLTHYPRPAAMPDAQAAILAAHEFVPEAVSALLDRTRHHYERARAAA
jgi:hypothetical protein